MSHQAVELVRASGIGSASGVRVDLELTMAYELRDDLIMRANQYDTVDDARAAKE